MLKSMNLSCTIYSASDLSLFFTYVLFIHDSLSAILWHFYLSKAICNYIIQPKYTAQSLSTTRQSLKDLTAFS